MSLFAMKPPPQKKYQNSLKDSPNPGIPQTTSQSTDSFHRPQALLCIRQAR